MFTPAGLPSRSVAPVRSVQATKSKETMNTRREVILRPWTFKYWILVSRCTTSSWPGKYKLVVMFERARIHRWRQGIFVAFEIHFPSALTAFARQNTLPHKLSAENCDITERVDDCSQNRDTSVSQKLVTDVHTTAFQSRITVYLQTGSQNMISQNQKPVVEGRFFIRHLNCIASAKELKINKDICRIYLQTRLEFERT